jgi:hypothetical protein
MVLRLVGHNLRNIVLMIPGKETKECVVTLPTMKAYAGSRSIAPFIWNLNTRWWRVVRFGTDPLYHPLHPARRASTDLMGLSFGEGNALSLSGFQPQPIAYASSPYIRIVQHGGLLKSAFNMWLAMPDYHLGAFLPCLLSSLTQASTRSTRHDQDIPRF